MALQQAIFKLTHHPPSLHLTSARNQISNKFSYVAPDATPGEVRRIPLFTSEELVVGILLLFFVSLGVARAWGEGERPVVRGSLRAPLPKPGKKLRMEATDRADANGSVRLHLRALKLVRYPATGASGAGSLELLLPVPAEACSRWRDETGHGCDRVVRLNEAGLSLTWQRTQTMHVRMRRASWWSLRPAGSGSPGRLSTGWSMESSSSSIRASVTCFESVRFLLVTTEGSIRSRCVSGARPMRLLVSRGSGEDILSFHGVEEMRLRAKAGRVSSVVESGMATADDQKRSVQGLGEKIDLTSDSAAVEVGVDGPASSTRFRADAARAASVKVGGVEVVPTLFDRYESLWWALLVSCVLGLFKACWDMYKSKPEGLKS